MKILVTGATGFIGYHVIHELLKKGYEVIASAPSLIKAKESDWFSHVCFIEHVIGEELSDENLFLKFKEPDKLIHLAWPGLPNYELKEHVTVYEQDQFRFISNLIQNGVCDITVAGTCFEYGLVDGELYEAMDPQPISQYGIAKNSLRINLNDLKKAHQFEMKWVRLFYTYGKGQNGRSIFSQLEQAIERGDTVFNMSGGKQLRDYLPIETVANYFVSIALQNRVNGIINCCSGIPVTIEEMVKSFLKANNYNISLNLGYYPYNNYEPMSFWGDRAILNQVLRTE